MAKAIRELKEKTSSIHVIIEVLDARAPLSSRNPVLGELFPDKPRLILMNKMDLCDSNALGLYLSKYKAEKTAVLPINALTGTTAKKVQRAILDLAPEHIAKKKSIRAVVFGIPNVGKSTLINHLIGKKTAIVGNKPGVTKKQLWLPIGRNIILLDTPGILWPKFEDAKIGLVLASLSCIKDNQFQEEEIARFLCEFFLTYYPKSFLERFKLNTDLSDPMEILEEIGRKRGCFIHGNEINLDRVFEIVINEFRQGKLGKVMMDQV